MRRVRASSIRRSGLALGAGPWLLLLALAAYPDEFPLFPTLGNEGASGMVRMRQPWSPFGVSVDEAGRVLYDVTVEAEGLPPVDGEVYRVWLTEPTLEHIVHAGTVEPDRPVTARTELEQLMVIVSREPADRDAAPGDRWSGPIVLRGFSAGARVQPLGGHSIFQPRPM